MTGLLESILTAINEIRFSQSNLLNSATSSLCRRAESASAYVSSTLVEAEKAFPSKTDAHH